MDGKSLGREEIYGIVAAYKGNGEGISGGEGEVSRMEIIESVADTLTREYELIGKLSTARGQDSPFRRELDYDFTEAISPAFVEQLTPVEQRIKRSDSLALHYAIATGGVDHVLETYLDSLTPEELAEVKKDDDKLLGVTAEVVAKFVVKQREKSGEDELVEKFPDAPTTGFEFEYTDPLRALTNELYHCPRRLAILRALLNNDEAQLRQSIIDKEDVAYFDELKAAALKAITADNPNGDRAYVEQEVRSQEAYQAYLLKHTRAYQGMDLQTRLECGMRYTLQTAAAAQIAAEVKQLSQLRNSAEEPSDSERAILERPLHLVLGNLQVSQGEDLTIRDVNAIRLLVPSPAKRLEAFAPFRVKDELFSQEELITDPSVSVRMQLRDFVYAARAGAFSDRLSVHQTIGGVELNPERTDFMEVTAILDAADYNSPGRDVSETLLEVIEAGHSAFSDPYRKISTCVDGGKYYFPYHKVRSENAAVAYPQDKRPLVELRAKRAFYPQVSFAAHVRASTFTWLAAWGEQAANIEDASRTPQQRDLADAWTTLLSDWSHVLKTKDIYQPQGSERYQDVKESEGHVAIVGEEKYSLYIDRIVARRIREQQQQISNNSDSLQYQARRLITEYDKKVKAIIGY